MEKVCSADTKAIKKYTKSLKNFVLGGSFLLARSGSLQLAIDSYRLVYEVNDSEIVIFVIAFGKRERDLAYIKTE